MGFVPPLTGVGPGIVPKRSPDDECVTARVRGDPFRAGVTRRESPQEPPLISHHDKCLFVHVPKCAGQSVEMFFLDRIGLDWERRAPLLLRPNDVPALGPPRLAHLKAAEYVEKR